MIRLSPLGVLAALGLLGCISSRPLETTRSPRPIPRAWREIFAHGTASGWACREAGRHGDALEYDLEIYAREGSRDPDVRAWFFDATGGEGEARPAVLILPILGGGYTAERIVARRLARGGISSALLRRPGPLLRDDRTPEDVRDAARATVRGGRMILDWMQIHPGVRAEKLGVVGISLGGILVPYLAAADPRISAGFVVMGGGDLPTVLRDSAERAVARYRQAQADEIGSEEALLDRMRETVRPDPLEVAGYLDPARFHLVIARYDQVVPTRNQRLLWESLGRPEATFIASGHYTAILYSWAVGARMVDFFQRKFGLQD